MKRNIKCRNEYKTEDLGVDLRFRGHWIHKVPGEQQ